MTRVRLISSTPNAIAMLEPDRSYEDFPFQSAVPGRVESDPLHCPKPYISPLLTRFLVTRYFVWLRCISFHSFPLSSYDLFFFL